MTINVLVPHVSATADVVVVNIVDGLASLPSARLLAEGSYTRVGPDLVITGPDGAVVVVVDYFAVGGADLTAPGSFVLSAQTVASLAGEGGIQVAALEDVDQLAQLAAPIGTVAKISGTVTLQRADGTVVEAAVGDDVYQGDVVITDANGTIGITFIDGSTFSLGARGRMVLDEMVFDPASGQGDASVSLMSGVFSFVSGQIAKSGPDAMEVRTPVATIGIRGTSGTIRIGDLEVDGDTQLQVILIPDPSGAIGEIIITTPDGRITTIGTAFQGINVRIGEMQSFFVSAADFMRDYGDTVRHLDANYGDTLPGVNGPADGGPTDGEGPNDGAPNGGEPNGEETGTDGEGGTTETPPPGDRGEGGSDDGSPVRVTLDQEQLDSLVSQGGGGSGTGPAARGGPSGSSTSGPQTSDSGRQGDDDTTTPREPTVPDAAFSGRVLDGYIKNAFVYIDANGNGQWDAGEAYTISDEIGAFTLSGTGVVRTLGGTDVLTGADMGALSAGSGSTVISPLTHLLTILRANGASDAAATAKLAAAFGLPTSGINFGTFDPIAAARSGGAEAALGGKVLLAGVMVQNALTVLSAALVGAGIAADDAQAAVSRALAKALSTDDGALVLGDAAAIAGVLDAAVAEAGGVTAEAAERLAAAKAGVAQILKEIGDRIASLSTDGGGGDSLLYELGRLAIVAQKTAAADVASGVASGDVSALGEYTGANLDQALAAAANDVGNLAGPVRGGAGPDVLTGTMFADQIEGLGGNDTLIGGAGNDSLDGGAGSDWAIYSSATSPVTIDLAAGVAVSADLGADTLISIENVVGGAGNDWFSGSTADNTFVGGQGADVFVASAGNDVFADIDLAQGDRLDMSRVGLTGWPAIRSALRQDGADTVIDYATGSLRLIGVDAGSLTHAHFGLANTAPTIVAGGIGVSVSEDSSVSGNLLATASDIDGDVLKVVQTGTYGLAYGTIVITANGAYTYTPNAAGQALAAGESAVDKFVFTATDPSGATASSVLTLTVSGRNDAPTVATTLSAQSGADAGVVSLDVSSGFADVDASDSLTFTATGLPPGLTISAAGLISGALGGSASVAAPYTVTVTATDTSGASVSQTFAWSVANPAPTATPATVTVGEDAGAVSGNLLATVQDSNGDTLSITTTGTYALTYGTLVVNSNGSYTYTPNVAAQALAAGQTGIDTFTFTASDSGGGTASSVLTLAVSGSNDAPTVATTLSAQSGADAGVVSLDVSSGFADVDASDSLVFTATGLPPGLVISAAGVITGTLDSSASATAPYTVMVTATDGSGASASQTFAWSVSNPAPTATAATVTLGEDDGAVSGNLLNAVQDSDGDALSVTAGTYVLTYGTMVVSSDGSYTYTLNAAAQALADGDTRVDTFAFEARDADGATVSSTLSLGIIGQNDAPTVAATLTAQSGADAGAVSLDVSSGFADVDINDNLVFTATGLPPGLTISAAGLISGTLSGSASTAAPYTVTVTATDGSGASASQTFAWSVSNPAPTATAATVTLGEDDGAVSGNLLDMVQDSDGDTLTITTTGTHALTHGTLVVGSDGSYTYTPNAAAQALAAGETGTDIFTFVASDGQGGTVSSTLTLSVIGADEPPVLETLDGTNGFALSGGPADRIFGSDIAIGDVNGDGYADVLVGSKWSNGEGRSYVIFGTADGGLATDDVTTLDGTNGFVLNGTLGDYSGQSVALGDWNGDGFDDIVILAGGSDPGEYQRVSVVLGKADWAAGSYNLDPTDIINGTDGFEVVGTSNLRLAGQVEIGDLNGDGFADIMVSAASQWQSAGAVVIFGEASIGAATRSVQDEDILRLSDITAEHMAVGDWNGDGISDMVMGRDFSAQGVAVLRLGGADFSTGGFYCERGYQGLMIVPPFGEGQGGGEGGELGGEGGGSYWFAFRMGVAMGDLNGDGFDDMVLGAGGSVYAAMGRGGDLTSYYQYTDTLTEIVSGYGSVGRTLAAGDFNGDGIDDLVIGDPYGGSNVAGRVYIVWGGEDFGAVDLATLTPEQGMVIEGGAASFVGLNLSVGDFNQDGIDDLAIGTSDEPGMAYVVFGADFTSAITELGGAGADVFTGTAEADVFVGGLGDDTLIGGGAGDVFLGGAGNDVVELTTGEFQRLAGGAGVDSIVLREGFTGQLATIGGEARMSGFEVLDLVAGDGGATLMLSVREAMALASGVNGAVGNGQNAIKALVVKGDGADTLDLFEDGWAVTSAGVDIGDGQSYNLWTHDDAGIRLYVDTDIEVLPNRAPTVVEAVTVYANDFEGGALNFNHGEWTFNSGSDWAVGEPGGDGSVNSAPMTGASGSYVLDTVPGGTYSPSKTSIATLTLDLSGFGMAQLDFQSWLVTEGATWDNAYIRASTNYSSWTTLLPAPTETSDTAWRAESISLNQFAGHSTVYVQWVLTTDSSINLPGWSIDDVTVTAHPVSLDPVLNLGKVDGGTGPLTVSVGQLGGFYTDVDGDPIGVALTAAGTAFGSWSYSLDDGDTWTEVGDVSTTAALLLPDTALLSYTASETANGIDRLDFLGWDGREGTPGGVLDTTNSGAVSIEARAAEVIGGPDAWTIDVGAGQVTNDGILNVLSDATLTLDGLEGGVFANTGTLNNAGTVATAYDGHYSGKSTFLNSGIVAGGLSLDWGWSFEQTETGRLELGNIGAANHDMLLTPDAATFGGTLALATDGAYVPTADDSFDVIQYYDVVGDGFHHYEGLDLGNGFVLHLDWRDGGDYNYVTASAVAVTDQGTANGDAISSANGVAVILAGGGDDFIGGVGTDDIVYAGDGDDSITVVSNDFARIDGGAGIDTVVFGGNVNLGAFTGLQLDNVEIIDIQNSSAGYITVSEFGVKSAGSNNELIILGDADDYVLGLTGWTNVGIDGDGYDVWTRNGATVRLDGAQAWPMPTLLTPDTLGSSGVRITGASPLLVGTGGRINGDINGDGFVDMVLGSYGANSVHVVFGTAEGLPDTVDMGDHVPFDGSDGVTVTGITGRHISVADVNGDGFDDVVIGSSDRAVVVFGKGTWSAGTYAVGDIVDAVEFTKGISSIYMQGANQTGDINGDGFADIFVVANSDWSEKDGTIILGGPAMTDEMLGSGTTTLRYVDNLARLGEVAFGDFNGDGVDDLLVGRGFADGAAAGVLFGNQSLAIYNDFGSDPLHGFTLEAASASGPFHSAHIGIAMGDFDGDGLDDVMIGAAGRGHEVASVSLKLGTTASEAATYDTADLITVVQEPGMSVGRILASGDFNGDGFADIAMSAPYDDAGAVYLLWGGSTPTLTDLQDLTPETGLTFNTGIKGAGLKMSVGDYNGDGIDDLYIGVDTWDVKEAYILYGDDFSQRITHHGDAGDNVFTGTAEADRVVGGRGNDTFTGASLADVFLGGAGDDRVIVHTNDFLRLDGGDGIDILELVDGFSDSLTNGAGPNRVNDFEIINMVRGDGGSTLTLSAAQAQAAASSVNDWIVGASEGALDGLRSLVIDGDALDTLNISGFTSVGTVSLGGEGYTVYETADAAIKLYVDGDIGTFT